MNFGDGDGDDPMGGHYGAGGRGRREPHNGGGELADKGSGDGGPYPTHHGRSLPACERAAQDKALPALV